MGYGCERKAAASAWHFTNAGLSRTCKQAHSQKANRIAVHNNYHSNPQINSSEKNEKNHKKKIPQNLFFFPTANPSHNKLALCGHNSEEFQWQPWHCTEQSVKVLNGCSEETWSLPLPHPRNSPLYYLFQHVYNECMAPGLRIYRIIKQHEENSTSGWGK